VFDFHRNHRADFIPLIDKPFSLFGLFVNYLGGGLASVICGGRRAACGSTGSAADTAASTEATYSDNAALGATKMQSRCTNRQRIVDSLNDGDDLVRYATARQEQSPAFPRQALRNYPALLFKFSGRTSSIISRL
jgi:hypothetical protein